VTTWAKFFWHGGSWHFQGFTGHLAAVREFEDFCAGEGVPSVVLALTHPPFQGTGKPGRKVKRVTTKGDVL